MPSTTSSLRPMLSTVSIIPGMEILRRPAGEQQRVPGTPFLPAAIDLGDVGADFVHQGGGELLAGFVVLGTGGGGDGEAGGDGQACGGHVGKIGALAAEQVLHVVAPSVFPGPK